MDENGVFSNAVVMAVMPAFNEEFHAEESVRAHANHGLRLRNMAYCIGFRLFHLEFQSKCCMRFI